GSARRTDPSRGGRAARRQGRPQGRRRGAGGGRHAGREHARFAAHHREHTGGPLRQALRHARGQGAGARGGGRPVSDDRAGTPPSDAAAQEPRGARAQAPGSRSEVIVRRAPLAAVFSLLLVSVASAEATEVRMLFPTDQLTEADPRQLTGRRVHLSLVNCVAAPSTCDEISLLNDLDGWSVNPRMTLAFTGRVALDSITR